MSTTESLEIPVEPPPEPPSGNQTTENPRPKKRWWTRRWVKWTALGAVVILVLGVGAGLWVNQNSAQNDKLDALLSQQASERAAAQAKDKAAAAAAAAKAKKDAEVKAFQQALALQKAQQDAADAKSQAAAAQAQAQANANKPPTVVVQPPVLVYRLHPDLHERLELGVPRITGSCWNSHPRAQHPQPFRRQRGRGLRR